MTADVPVTHQEAAERVRAHLVLLRGGAPFLSPDDAALLLSWLDDGVPVARILRGLEHASDQRRARKQRAPLSLRHARRHLGKPRGAPSFRAPVAAEPASHPLDPILAALERHAGPDPAGPSRRAQLGTALHARTERGEALAAEAIHAVALWHDATWRELDSETRQDFRTRAEAPLEDVLDLLSDEEIEELIEEHARGLARECYPYLSATTILQLLV